MLKKTIKYVDPMDGQEKEEDAYFNLTKAEAIELNIRNDLEVIGRSKDNNEIMDTFQRVLSMSYGRRTGDGKFIKEPRDFTIFRASEAYSELFMEIWQNPEYAAEFIRAILPIEIQQEEGLTNSQGNVPTGLQQHPSMQGFRAPQSAPAQERTLPVQMTPAVQPGSLGENDAEYQEYLFQKRLRKEREAQAQIDAEEEIARAEQIPPAQVSPEVPQTDEPPRSELI